ncbi:MAG: transposase [Gammaproteobacteria bacterium]
MINVDRNTPMLLPPDLRDWVEDDDLVHFIVDVSLRVSAESASVNHRGCGSAQYPPSMMLALLLYCYSQGIYSSRKVERATYSNVPVRYLTANHHPDHDTIATFRRKNKEFIKQAFVTTVQIAQEFGFTKLGVMAIDGTSLRADASKKATKSFGELRRQIEGICAAALDQAEVSDTALEQPECRPRPAKNKIDAALEKIKTAYAADKAQRAELTRQVKASGVGTPPLPTPQEVPDAKLVNLTDVDCHAMRMKEGYAAPGYNAQLAVDTKTLLITAATISDSCVDSHQLLVVAQESQKNCRGAVHTVVADSGYDNNHQIHELAVKHGIHAVVAVQDPHRISTKHNQGRQRQRTRALKLKRIKELGTPRGRELIATRSCSVEPVFGIIKQAMGFRRFLQRGMAAVANEWTLVSAAFNLKRLLHLLMPA